MNKKFFNDIQNSDIPIGIKKASEELSHSFDEKNNDELEKLIQISYILYVYNEVGIALEIVDELSDYVFNGDYDFWTWIDAALVLNIRLKRLSNQGENIPALKDKILSPLSIGNEIQIKVKNKVYKRFLEGDTLAVDKIQEAVDSNEKDREAARRISYLIKLMKISEMGGSESFSIEKAESEIKSNQVRLKSLLDEIDIALLLR